MESKPETSFVSCRAPSGAERGHSDGWHRDDWGHGWPLFGTIDGDGRGGGGFGGDGRGDGYGDGDGNGNINGDGRDREADRDAQRI